MDIQIQNSGGAGTVNGSETVFGAAYNEALVHQVVVAYQAGSRAGTRAQKNRSAVRGGGTKPWRQKGTGRARAGTIRSPIWRGGGKTFPAQTKDFGQKVNRKMYRGAMRSILSELVRQERLTVVSDIAPAEPRTRLLAGRLSDLFGDNGKDVLIVDSAPASELRLAARNLPYVDVSSVVELDPVRLIRHKNVAITAEALSVLQEQLK